MTCSRSCFNSEIHRFTAHFAFSFGSCTDSTQMCSLLNTSRVWVYKNHNNNYPGEARRGAGERYSEVNRYLSLSERHSMHPGLPKAERNVVWINEIMKCSRSLYHKCYSWNLKSMWLRRHLCRNVLPYYVFHTHSSLLCYSKQPFVR